MNKANVLATGILALVFSSCQVKVAPVEAPSVTPAAEASIVGIWSTDCIVNGNDSSINSFQVENGTLTWASSQYKETNVCDSASLSHTFMKSGTLTITGDSSALSGGKNYELRLNVVAVVPNSASFTAMLNAGNVCGSNTWTSGQAGFVFGCIEPNALDLSLVFPNTTHYGVFDIESAATPNYMQFESVCSIAGYEGMCPTANDRPATLDGTVYFRR